MSRYYSAGAIPSSTPIRARRIDGFRSKESVMDFRTAMPAAGTAALVLIADVAAPTYRQQLGKA
jgi:hypothetical protein